MDRKKLTDWLVYLAVRVFICLLQSARIESCHTVARILAWIVTDIVRLRARVIDDNLRHAFPSLPPTDRVRVAREMWEHLILMVCEVAHTPRKIHRTNWGKHVEVTERRTVVRYLLDERPILLVSGHFGNFEVGGYVAGLLGFPTYTVARPLDNPYLDDYLNRFRASSGQFIVPKDNSASQLDALLAKGATLTLLGDQHAGRKGCWVDFFGRPASCHKAIALFTLTSQAPLVVTYTQRLDQPLHFRIGLEGLSDPANGSPEQSNVVTLTQWYNRCLERFISRQPSQYWWLHRRWKEQPARRPRNANIPAAA